jgi:hypothetical protein
MFGSTTRVVPQRDGSPHFSRALLHLASLSFCLVAVSGFNAQFPGMVRSICLDGLRKGQRRSGRRKCDKLILWPAVARAHSGTCVCGQKKGMEGDYMSEESMH